jgi:hypothetical protein
MGTNEKTPAVDWNAWKPGWSEAGQTLQEIGLAKILEDYGITIPGVSATTLTQIGPVLADGIAQGVSTGEVGRKNREFVGGDRQLALTIAETVTARAMESTSHATYARNGVKQLDWLAGGPNECDDCADNAANSPYAIDDFPTLPFHPNCACASAAHCESARRP